MKKLCCEFAKHNLKNEFIVDSFPVPACKLARQNRNKIYKGRKIEKETPPGSSAGEISGIEKEGIEVCCGEGSTFLIECLQPENRRRMDAYAFSLGAEIKTGDRFA